MEIEVRQKRYEFFGRDGKQWTEWFDYDGEEYPYQMKPRLRNEYRTIRRMEEEPQPFRRRKRRKNGNISNTSNIGNIGNTSNISNIKT